MYHTNGFNPLVYLLGGDRLIVLEKFDAATVLDVIERYRVTTFTATPTMLGRIADVPGAGHRDLSSVEWIMQGAAAMPPELLHRWFDLLSPEQVIMAYGMTENLGLATLRGDEWLRHPGSVGRGFRETEIRILDEHGAAVPTGEIGEIYLRAPMNDAYRYLGGAVPPEPTPDGFRSAGDLGRLDEDGYLYVADRRTDMIVSGGANVFPAEVENALIAHSDIADVVVLGLKDAEWGRRVHAVVQLADGAPAVTADDLIRYAKGRLARYKVPKTVEFVDEIPLLRRHEGEPLGDDRGAGWLMGKPTVAIIGAGAGGIAMGVRLGRAGYDYDIFDRADGFGGTWRHNTYPGAACDVPSHLYSFSFRAQSVWSKTYADQPEILAYLEKVAVRARPDRALPRRYPHHHPAMVGHSTTAGP